MSDIPEVMGELAQAGMVARAVEPAAGEGGGVSADGHTAEGSCLNCGEKLVGPHCYRCGQRAHVHRTLAAFMHDLVHGVLHFEGKFWRTLPLLAWRPGTLTREYIDGKRASYISPIALFLFTVFVSFALFNAAGGFGDNAMKLDENAPKEIQAGVVTALDGEIARAQDQLAEAKAQGRDTAALEKQLAEWEKTQEVLGSAQASIGLGDAKQGADPVVTGPAATGPAAKGPAAAAKADTRQGDKAGQWLQDTWEKAKANPKLLLYKLQTNAYKLSWLLIPLSLPFVWLLFPFSRKFRMYDHTVFVTYSISFMTMLVVVASVASAYNVEALVIAPILYAPFHLYRSLRGTYSLTRMGALLRMILLSVGCFIAMMLFVIIMFGLVLSG